MTGKRPKRRIAGEAVVAYLRVSTEDQDLGLDAQRAAIEAWAHQQGVHVTAWREDRAVSGGSSLTDRPALVEAISHLRRGDRLVVAKRDRLARDVWVAAQVDRMVRAAGASIVSADNVGNGDSPADQLMRHMLDGMAQFERHVIAARTAAALAAKARRGERVGTIAYGYRLADDGVHLEPCEAEQRVVARAHALNTDTRSCQDVADALADEGLLNRAGKPFARQAIHLMLTTTKG